jgi:hypothetical protein
VSSHLNALHSTDGKQNVGIQTALPRTMTLGPAGRQEPRLAGMTGSPSCGLNGSSEHATMRPRPIESRSEHQ